MVLEKKSVPVLNEMGIYTIGDFADEKNEQKILRKLGKSSYSFDSESSW